MRVGSRRALTTIAAVCSLVLAGAVVAAPAATAASNPTPKAGQRRNATRESFTISGTASLSVDVGTGNALFTDQLITLPGVRSSVPITLAYNSSVWGTSTPSAVTNDSGSGWVISGFDQRLVTNADSSVTFYGPAGLTGVFASAGGNNYTAPKQFQADLVKTTSPAGWTLTEHTSRTKLTFNSSGRLTKMEDRDGNATTFSYDGSGYPSQVQSSRGSTTTRTLTVSTSGGRITQLAQSDGSGHTRTVGFGYSNDGHLASVTDTAGGITYFDSGYGGPDNGQVVRITKPAGSTTTLTFDGSNRVTKVAQSNPPIDGGAGESDTRLTYPSSTQTLEADPTTDQGQPVSSVPHTTYTIDSSTQLVTGTTDPNGHSRSDTYTSLDQIHTDTPAAGGTTTFSYGANSGESLTSVATPGGATSSAAYTNSGANAYLPSSTTDSAGNATKYTYDAAGNQLTVAQGTGQQAKVTYNSDGTVATSASPGAASGQQTSYSYDSLHNLTTVTPPSNSSLGSRSYTWDGYGRLATATDGQVYPNTISYGYDNLDRITSVSYSDGTPTVSYTYDKLGYVTQRVDGSGTTTYRYDDLGHLLSTSNTANGKTVTYTYDLAGALATTVDGLGTVTYHYDPAHELTSMDYPQGGSTYSTYFANNADGKRTDVWLQSNSSHSAWQAHEHFGYDSSGRISTVFGQDGPAATPTTIINETLCYASGVSAQSCTSAPASADRSDIQSTYESVTGETNTYTYDDHDRLTKDVITGGSNPRTYSYGYDEAGNRTSSSVTGSSPSSQSLTYNAGNQIASSGYSYDGAGNLTGSPARTATFNAAGQQTSATVSGVKTTYTWAGTNENEVLSEAIPNDHTYTLSYGRSHKTGLPSVDSVSANGIGTGYVMQDPDGQPIMLGTSTGNTILYVYDGLHNPVILSANNTTSQVYAFDPYGGRSTLSSTGFSSKYEDPYTYRLGIRDRATGEIKFGQRFYSPTTGNWTQQDALNAPLDPHNANRYEYARDNAINDTDLTGQDANVGTYVGLGVAAVGVGVAIVGTFGFLGVGGLFAGGEAVAGEAIGWFAGDALGVGAIVGGGITAAVGGTGSAISSLF